MRASIEEYKAVEAAAMKFVKSVAEGDSRYAKELFTEDAVLFGFLDGALERGSIDQFYRNVDSVAAGDKFKARIDVVAVEETLAVVRVLEEGWGGCIDFTDYLLLLKIDGEWRRSLRVRAASEFIQETAVEFRRRHNNDGLTLTYNPAYDSENSEWESANLSAGYF